MKRFVQRENILLDFSHSPPQGTSLMDNSSEDLDFNDVFGGPPRRFSMQEVRTRYSVSDPVVESEEEEDRTSSPWSNEKPVFGEENVTTRRRYNDDFFDDIFRGGDESSSYSSPRRSGNLFGSSSPASRISSPPDRTLPPQAETFGASLPAAAHLSKLTKAMDSPTTFSCGYHQSPHKKKDAAPSATLSNRPPGYRQSPLSHQVSISTREETPSPLVSVSDVQTNSKADLKNAGDQFHFSIYKWAGREIPMLMPLPGDDYAFLKSKEMRRKGGSLERRSSVTQKHGLQTNVEPMSLNKENGQAYFSKAFLSNIETKSENSAKDDNNVEIIADKAAEEEEEEEVKSVHMKEETIKEAPKSAKESRKKPLFVLLKDEFGKQDFIQGKGGNLMTKAQREALSHKSEGRRSSSNQAGRKQSPSSLEEETCVGRSEIKGKVKEFVQIFNQETSSRHADAPPSQSSRWNKGISSINQRQDEVPVKDEAKQSYRKNPRNQSKRTSTDNKDVISSELVPDDDSKVNYVENSDDLSEYFQVQELPEDQVNVSRNDSEDIKAADARIHQWSLGKKGNIHSLLSTLQYVLWPQSGWKAIPLVDLIEANSVRRAYQKAMLCLHPDKLQQKGAAYHHKYIAEKVFDILQEAWDHFNSLGGL